MMNQQATNAFRNLAVTLHHFFTNSGSGYEPTHEHATRQPPTTEGALALIASADWILSQRAKRGQHFHSLVFVIVAQREELLEALDQVPGKPATAIAAGRRAS